MNTRYYDMFTWGTAFGIFSVFTIMLYCICNKVKLILSSKKTFELGNIIVPALLIIFAAIRCNCGSDYYNYYLMYNYSTEWFDSLFEVITARFQNGYMTVAYIVKSCIGGEFTIFVIIACAIYIPVIYLMNKRLKNQEAALALWFFLGFFSLTLNIVKQSVAMVFILIAYDNIYEKKYVKFFFFSFLACWFHISSAYVILAIMIAQKKWKIKKMYYFLICISLILLFFISPFLKLIKNVLPANYKHYIDYYLGQDISSAYKLQLGAIIVTIVFMILLHRLVENYNKLSVISNYCSYMIKVMILVEPFLILGIRFYLLNRISYEAFQFLPFVYSEYIYMRKKKKKLIWLEMLFYCIVISILCGENNYYNYSTIYNDIPCSVRQFVIR